MLSLQVTNIKKFMSLLLGSNAFDSFLLEEAVIQTNTTISIDGRMTKGFYNDEEKEELGLDGLSHIPYGLVREKCFELIKGKKTPVYFKFVFLLPQATTDRLMQSVSTNFDHNVVTNMCLICTYQEGTLYITDGVSYQTFVLGHDLDKALDDYIKAYLNKSEISFEETM